MTVRNVAEILEFSDIYDASRLKKAALTFISMNLADLLEGGHLRDINRTLAEDITLFYRNMVFHLVWSSCGCVMGMTCFADSVCGP